MQLEIWYWLEDSPLEESAKFNSLAEFKEWYKQEIDLDIGGDGVSAASPSGLEITIDNFAISHPFTHDVEWREVYAAICGMEKFFIGAKEN